MKKINKKNGYNLFLRVLLCLNFISIVNSMNPENFIDCNTPSKDNSAKGNKNEQNVHSSEDKNKNPESSQSLSDKNDDFVMNKNEFHYDSNDQKSESLKMPSVEDSGNKFPDFYILEYGNIENEQKDDIYENKEEGGNGSLTPNEDKINMQLIKKMDSMNKDKKRANPEDFDFNTQKIFIEQNHEFVLPASEEMNFYKCIDMNNLDLSRLMLFSGSLLPKNTKKELVDLIVELFSEIINQSNFLGKENFDKMIDDERIFTCNELYELILDIESVRRLSEFFVTLEKRDALYNSFLKFKNLIKNINIKSNHDIERTKIKSSNVKFSDIKDPVAKLSAVEKELKRTERIVQNMGKDFYETMNQKNELIERLTRCLKIMKNKDAEIDSLRRQNEALCQQNRNLLKKFEEQELQLAIAISMQDDSMIDNNVQNNMKQNQSLQKNKTSQEENKTSQQSNDDSSFEEYSRVEKCKSCGNNLTSRQIERIDEENVNLTVENLSLQEKNSKLRKDLESMMSQMDGEIDEETCAIIMSMQEEDFEQCKRENEFVMQIENNNKNNNNSIESFSQNKCDKCRSKFTIDQIQDIKERNKYLIRKSVSLNDDNEMLNELVKKVSALKKTNVLSKDGNNKMQDEGDEYL